MSFTGVLKSFFKKVCSVTRDKFEFTIAEDITKSYNNELYSRLVKNLDEEGVATVDTVIRLSSIMHHKHSTLFGNKLIPIRKLLTPEEIKKRKQIEKEMGNVTKLSDDKFSYNGHLLPVNDFEVDVFYYNYNLDKVDNISKISDKCIIDVGAYTGDSAIIFSPLTDKTVYCFEPVEKHIQYINKTIEYNNLRNVIPIQYGLGDKQCTIDFYVHGGGSGYIPNVNSPRAEKTTASIITLDSFVEENNLEVGLIKVDIEGAEQDLIKGALNTIKTQKPILIISIYHSADDFFNIKPIIEELNLGYKFKVVKSLDLCMLTGILLICQVE